MTASSAQTLEDHKSRGPDPMEVLIRAFVGDGFTVDVFHGGPADQPDGLRAHYLWEEDDRVDLIAVRRGGPAAVARLAGPVDIKNPQGPAEFAWTGSLDSVISALFGLAEPGDPEAPNEQLAVPAEITSTRAWEQHMRCHRLTPQEPGARADRLRLAQIGRANSREYFEDLFRFVDLVKVLAFVERFAPGAAFRFAGFPTVNGPDAILRQVAMIHGMFASVRHLIHHYQEEPDRAATIRGEGIFVRHDGSTVTAPFVTYTQFDSNYLIHRHEGYVDLLPVLPCLNCGHRAV
jgi:hypothetical protein